MLRPSRSRTLLAHFHLHLHPSISLAVARTYARRCRLRLSDGPLRRVLPRGDAPQRRLRHLRRRRRVRWRAGTLSLPPSPTHIFQINHPFSVLLWFILFVVFGIWFGLVWLQAVDYGVHKLWEMNNIGVIFSLLALISCCCLAFLDSWGTGSYIYDPPGKEENSRSNDQNLCVCCDCGLYEDRMASNSCCLCTIRSPVWIAWSHCFLFLFEFGVRCCLLG